MAEMRIRREEDEPAGGPAKDAVAAQRRALLELVQLDKSDLETSIPRILEADARALGVERVSFWSLAPDRSFIRCEKLFCLSRSESSSGGELRAQDFPSYFRALLDNRVIVADDALTDPRTCEFREPYFRQHGITSLLDVPVWQRGRLAGVLCHEHVGQRRAWREFEADFAVSMGGMISAGFEGHQRRHAETRYELLTAAMNDLVWDWDLRTDEIEWTDAVYNVLRFPRGQVKASLAWWKENVHPEDLPRIMQGLDEYVKRGAGLWRAEYRFRRGDGSWAIIEDRGVIERLADGSPRRMVGAMVDVSEQRRMQQRLSLADRMASVGTLAAGIAHEINNPLTYVAANLHSTLRMVEQSAPHQRMREALEEAEQGVQRVQAIVRDLKTFSRPDEVELGPVDVRAVIESSLNIAHNALIHRARVRREHGDIPPVKGNAARLGQVLLNLLMNAVQALPEASAEEHEIAVRSTFARGKVVIEVRDTGVGIPPENLHRVFDPFFTTKAVGVGTGLGLGICHTIISEMGGSLILENNADRGVLARVELNPASPRTPPKGCPGLAGRASTPLRRGRVLVIDDLPNVGTSMKRLLEDEHDVDVFTDCRSALAAVERGERWDLVLCDLMMPQMSGMDFVRRLQQLAPELVSRVGIMTGGAFTPEARRFMAEWPHLRLEKPYRPEQLIALVRRMVDAAPSR